MTNDREKLLAENARLRAELEEMRELQRASSPAALPSEQVYRSIFRLSPGPITVTRFEDGTYYDVSDTFCRMTGVERNQALEASSLSLNLWVDPADREHVKALLERDGSYTNVEIDYIKAGGKVAHMLQSAELVTIGESRFIIAITTDITQRKEAEAKLARERERLSVTLHAISDAVIAIDAQHRVELMNRVAEALLGVKASDAGGRALAHVLRIHDESTMEPVADPAAVLLDDEAPKVTQFVLLDDGGARHTVRIETAPTTAPNGMSSGNVLVIRDETVRLRMEEHLRKSARLESLGILAGGIAHDFNNVLMGIHTNVEFAKDSNVDETERQEALDDVGAAVRQARDLTQQLLTFSRGGAPVVTSASIEDLLRDVAGFTLRGSSLRSEIAVDDDVHTVEIDRSQMSQVIENLVVNAMQVMDDGGALRISAVNEALPDGNGLSLPTGDYVRIRVQDDGPGIAEEDLPRIFDPFFTRRPGGTGLGLSIVHSVVKRHGGRVQVESVRGKGTRFDVYLPASRAERVIEQAEVPATRRGNERVLVMDDDAMVRRSLVRLLNQHGYRVEAAAEGQSAVEAFARAQSEGDPFAVTFLDLTVQGGPGGRTTVQQIRRLDPDARIVVSSGYSDDDVMANPGPHGFDARIAKPHDPAELFALLHALLDES